jgi:hypothetical protein
VQSLPGHPVSDEELSELEFRAFDLDVHSVDIQLPGGVGCTWTTIRDVPESPGVYAFTVDDGVSQCVAYVGRTSHLWMVTKGRLPRSGGARGGQRYGRPQHAGVTRRRVNLLIAAELRAGRRVRHWLRCAELPTLAVEEERLIRCWRLRTLGWNRG